MCCVLLCTQSLICTYNTFKFFEKSINYALHVMFATVQENIKMTMETLTDPTTPKIWDVFIFSLHKLI